MKLQTTIDIQKADFEIRPTDRILFVGSCFAENIGRIFLDNHFRTTINPYGVMYNPASILHTIARQHDAAISYDVVVITLGTNHVYILNETGEIVDNCQKQPAFLFTEKKLSVKECSEYLQESVSILKTLNPNVQVVFTVSPIRYAKYGYHENQLSKATLLLAIEATMKKPHSSQYYFPSYEIVMDELRDYRFYAEDMLHPSVQTVRYIYEKFRETFFSEKAMEMETEWQPIKKALNHRPFDAESAEYKNFIAKATADKETFLRKWKL